jgi:hypothetical protein
MEIEVTHHIDCSEIRPDGFYDWYYEYHLFRFTEGSSTFIVRAYVDSPEEAHFLSLQEGRKTRSLTPEDLQLPLFQLAVNHLREVGKTSITWLSPAACGYEPI